MNASHNAYLDLYNLIWNKIVIWARKTLVNSVSFAITLDLSMWASQLVPQNNIDIFFYSMVQKKMFITQQVTVTMLL